jgi:hypothetical protein
MNTDLFVQWLQHFQNHVKATETDPVLLIWITTSHCTVGAIMFCRDNYNFVKHSSSWITQDPVSWLWISWAPEIGLCDAFLVIHGNQSITQKNIAGVFKRAYVREATLDKAENSFRACGIYLFNPHVISPEDFGPAQVSFLPNIEAKETIGATVVQQRDEASPKPSTSASDAAQWDVLASDTSREKPASRTYKSFSKFQSLSNNDTVCATNNSEQSTKEESKK